MILGGWETKESIINYSAGIVLYAKTGEQVSRGKLIARLHTDDESKADEALCVMREAVVISERAPLKRSLILADVDSDGVKIYQ
jgi:pyrimidine-nucleoside phosphorylase